MTTRLPLPRSRRRWATSRFDEYGRHDDFCSAERPCARHETPWGGEAEDRRWYKGDWLHYYGGDSMPIIVKNKGGDFTPAPEGSYQAVCVDVIDLGEMETQWGKKEKVEIRWQIDALNDQGKPFLVMQRYTKSLNEKAQLRHHLEAWRGRAFTAEELDGFDLEKLLGANSMLQIIHRQGTKGGTFANVAAIMKLPKGLPLRMAEGYVRVKDRDTAEVPDHDAVEEEVVPF